jgi:two-component system NtrC family sensor kinase
MDDTKLRTAQAQLRTVLDAVESGVLVFDAAGRLIMANDRFRQLLGLSASALDDLGGFERQAEAIGGRFVEPQAFGTEWKSRHAGCEQRLREELEMLQPNHKLIERNSRPVLDGEGRRAGWIEIYRDISAQWQLHTRLLQTEKMAAIGQLISGIVHELNSPLTSIMGYAQLLLGQRLPPEISSDARTIYEEAERAGRIVQNLLLFARETQPARAPVNLNEIAERALALRRNALKLENISVWLDLDPNLPETLADAVQLQQVILNLLLNSEQAIQQAHGTGRICVRTARSGRERLKLEISDDGPGIPPELTSRVFDPFFTTKPEGTGTGLGLTIVYGIVHDHGGQVALQSEPGHGATFTIELPVAGRGAAGASKRLPAIRSFPSPLGSLPARAAAGDRILVVEDEPTVAQLITDVLRGEGHRVEKVLDSREALARAEREEYDLLICDLKMPHLDGQAIYRALVQSGNPLQHRIVIVTGDTLAPHTLEFLERSGLPYIAKPFLIEELKLAVERVLAGSSATVRIQTAGHAAPRPTDAARKP